MRISDWSSDVCSSDLIEMAKADLAAQANPDADAGDLEQRYPKAQVRDFDGDPTRVTELDALIAYLQMLGTLADVNSAAAQEERAQEKGRGPQDRKSVGEGKRGTVRVDVGVRRT